MIDVYTWPTPNGHKVHIMLEECGLPYQVHPIDIGKGEQFAPEFLAISPNNRIPAIVDRQGWQGTSISVFESGAILLYLADKTGKFLSPLSDMPRRVATIQWLMFQMGGVGPMFGQANHFRRYAVDKIDYAIERYTKESGRLCGVMDRQLQRHEYLAGADYSIADIAVYPWVLSGARSDLLTLSDYPQLERWCEAIAARPGVERGLKVLEGTRPPVLDDQAREVLYGATQHQRR